VLTDQVEVEEDSGEGEGRELGDKRSTLEVGLSKVGHVLYRAKGRGVQPIMSKLVLKCSIPLFSFLEHRLPTISPSISLSPPLAPCCLGFGVHSFDQRFSVTLRICVLSAI